MLYLACATAHAAPSPAQLRATIYRTHPCLARIIDRENGSWDPRRVGRGGSYGLPQAQPAEKMATAGRDWRTSALTQLRWMEQYVRQRYGSECAAWAWWRTHYWY